MIARRRRLPRQGALLGKQAESRLRSQLFEYATVAVKRGQISGRTYREVLLRVQPEANFPIEPRTPDGCRATELKLLPRRIRQQRTSLRGRGR